MTNIIDLGDSRTFEFYTDAAKNKIGGIERHKAADGLDHYGHGDFMCMGSVHFDTPEGRIAFNNRGPFWTLNSLDPLDISPSIRCLNCGDHGFIKKGKWVPA